MIEMKVPSSNASLNSALLQLTASKDVASWTQAAIIYAWTTTESFEIDRSAISAFTAAPGFKDNNAKVHAYREAYEVAMSEGLVKAISKGDTITVPTVKFSDYVAGSRWKVKSRVSKPAPKAKSRQQENLERDGHRSDVSKPTTAGKPSPTSKRQDIGPRVSTVQERGERIVQELRAQVKQEQDVGRRAIWEATLSVALNALNSYTKANA